MRPPERFATARLVVRRPLAADAQALFDEYAQDKEVRRYLTWRRHRAVAETIAFLETCGDDWTHARAFPFCMAMNGAPVGMINLRPRAHRVQFGYVLPRRLLGTGPDRRSAGLPRRM